MLIVDFERKRMKLLHTDNKKAWYIMTAFVVIFAAVLFFAYCLYYTSFTNDEFNSMSVAKNFASGRGFYADVFLDQWTNYTRAWPSTILLAGWIKLWGFSEFSCRSLSAVYGILFAISAIYITKKLFNNFAYSLVSALMMVSEHVTIKYFGTVRMYSLELLFTIWMYYFLYMGISNSNPFVKRNRDVNSNAKKGFFAELTDFHWGYLLAAALLLILNRYNMINSLIPLGGVGLYIVVKAIISTEKKYKYLTLAGLVLIFVFGLNLIFNYVSGHFLFLSKLFGSLVRHFKIGLSMQYLTYIGGVGLFGRWFLAIPVLGFIVVCCIIKKKLDDIVVYISTLCFFTIAFFVCFTKSHGFSSRYIIMLVPWMIMLFAYSVICAQQWKRKIFDFGIICLVVLEIAYGIRYMYIFGVKENPSNTDFVAAYSKISDYYDISNESVPVAYHMLRKYYYVQVIPEELIGEHRSLKKNRMTDDLIDFAKENPEGIVTIENIKIQYTSQDIDKLMFNWTDHIAGTGVDNYGVNISHYCFLSPDENVSKDCRNSIDISEDIINISLSSDELKRIADNYNSAQAVFVAIDMDMNDGTNLTRYYGLLLPQDYMEKQSVTYCLTDEMTRGIDNSEIAGAFIESETAIYSEGKLYENVNIFD